MTSANESLDTVTELIGSSKAKYVLAQSRLRGGEPELALLSLHGSIEDALRAHLLRYRLPSGSANWSLMLDSVRNDERQPLSTVEYERIQRMHTIRAKIARGDEVTLTHDTIGNYYELAMRLLPRYGVQILAGEDDLAARAFDTAPARGRLPRGGTVRPRELAELEDEAPPTGWQRYQRIVLPVLLIISIFLIGVSISIGLQQMRADGNLGGAPQIASATALSDPIVITTLPPATLGPTPELLLATPTASPSATPPPNVIAVGRRAVVQDDVIGGLNVRARPGTAAGIPILFSLAPGSLVDVIDGPVTADDLTWWKVRAANQEGWCAGEFLDPR